MKTKMLVLVGIVVCAILFASPVLASAGYTKIYGNANEDDVLDMRDVTYIKLVIFGKKPATTFADANYDGKISMLDIGQTKLIILGKEKKLTLVDHADRTVTVPRPIERVITLQPPITRMVIGVGAEDKLVGMGTWSHHRVPNQYGLDVPKWRERFAELKELPDVGTGYEPNLEVILSLTPDVVIAYAGKTQIVDIYDRFQEASGIVVVGYSGSTGDYSKMRNMFEHIKFIGTVLGKDDKYAGELVSYFDGKLDIVREVTSEIPDSEKPRVYFCGSSKLTSPKISDTIDLAGGINVAAGSGYGWQAEITKEQLIDWNPDIILLMKASKDTSKISVEGVLSDPDLQTINAVKNQRVYYSPGAYSLVGADPPRVVWETLYQAKRFHPDKFKDLDLEKEGNELFKRFYGADGLWTEICTELGFI